MNRKLIKLNLFYYYICCNIQQRKNKGKIMAIRYPYTHSEFISGKIENNEIPIAPNPEGTKPVPYKNYPGTHPMGSKITLDGYYTPFYLIWYVWEFLGHLHYITYDFESFIRNIATHENPDGPSKNDFTKYLGSMIKDSNTVYNRHVYAHFQVMWNSCNGDEEKWNTKLAELRKAFNTYIQKRMTDYEERTGDVHSVFGEWKTTLEPIYGDNWCSYLWQCTNFDELGHFISEHNEFFRKNEDAKDMVCKLNLPEEKQHFGKYRNQQLVKIDEHNNIVIWGVVVKHDDNTYVYPATPDVWTTGSFAMIPSVSTRRHNSIFPNGPASWIEQCKSKHIKVKFVVLEGDVTSSNYENYTIMENLQNIIVTKNKGLAMLETSPKRPVCGRNESLSDFSNRYKKWERLATLAVEHCRLVM